MYMRKACVAILVLAVAALMEPVAHASSVTVNVSGTGVDGPISAMLQFIPLTNAIEIIVTNTENGSLGVTQGQAISAFTFSISGINAPTEITGLSGHLITTFPTSWTATSGTSFNDTGTSTILDHWDLLAGPDLATAGQGGNPTYMILPSSGTNGGNGGSNFNPYIIGPGVFVLQDAGITTSTDLASDISGVVTVGFGTSPDNFLSTTVNRTVTTPEPGAILLLGVGLASVFGLALFRK
jgi:hypothetical protein